MGSKHFVILLSLLLGVVPISEGYIRRADRVLGDTDSALNEASIVNNEDTEGEKDDHMGLIYDPKENGEEGAKEDLRDTPILNMTYHGGDGEKETGVPGEEHATQAPTDAVKDEITVTVDESQREKSMTATDEPTVVETTDAPTSMPTAVEVLATSSPTAGPTAGPTAQPSTPSPTNGETESPTAKVTESSNNDFWWNDPNGKNDKDNNVNPTPSWDNAFENHGTEEVSPLTPSHEQQKQQHQHSSSSSQDGSPMSTTNPIDILEKEVEEIAHDKNVEIITPIFLVISFMLTICVAQQMVENPDGCCARLCRCTVGVCRFVTSFLCCCCCCMSSRDKARRTHDLIVTNGFEDYDHDLQLQ